VRDAAQRPRIGTRDTSPASRGPRVRTRIGWCDPAPRRRAGCPAGRGSRGSSVPNERAAGAIARLPPSPSNAEAVLVQTFASRSSRTIQIESAHHCPAASRARRGRSRASNRCIALYPWPQQLSSVRSPARQRGP